MAKGKNKIVCLCNGVTEKEILRILKLGARDLEEVKKITLASASCGRCKTEVEAISDRYLSSKTPDLQHTIKF